MRKFFGIVIPFSIFSLFTTLITWGVIGFIHMDIHDYKTKSVKINGLRYTRNFNSSVITHHSLASEWILTSFAGLIVILLFCSTFGWSWAWVNNKIKDW